MIRLETPAPDAGFLRPSFKRLAKRPWGFHLLLQAFQLQDLGLKGYVEWQAALFNAWIRERRNRGTYQLLDEAQLTASRKSDTVFIFGSGYSLNDITPEEWRHFGTHDTLGLSGFIYQQWVRVDYHLIRGWVEAKAGAFNWQGHSRDFANVLNANEFFKDTILILQGEYLAQFCNTLVGYGLLRPGTRIFRYRTTRGAKSPTQSFTEGLAHAFGTLSDAVNFAYCMGWKQIVLVGVDLYDSRYFWLRSHETLAVDDATGMLVPAETSTRGIRFDQKHNAVNHGILQGMTAWREFFERDKVAIAVYNPRSLLAEVLPVYRKN
jgi:hypothetical protein